MPDDRLELISGVVIRLPPREIDDEFHVDGPVPDAGDFALNSEEEDRARNGDGVGALSVWDRDLTTPEQAYAFLVPRTRLILDLDVERILEIPSKLRLAFGLHVFRDPEARDLPGAAGHCTIENVWADKQTRKKIRGALAALAKVAGILGGSAN